MAPRTGPSGSQACSPPVGLGPYRKEPLHPPVLPVGVPLRQRAAVHGVTVKGVIKTCREGRGMGSRPSSTSPEVSVTHQVTWGLLIPHWLWAWMHSSTSLCRRMAGSTLGTRRQELLLLSFPERWVSWVSLAAIRASALESSMVQQNPSLGEALTAPACEIFLELLIHLLSSDADFHQLHLFRPSFPSDCPARQAVRRPNHPLAQPRHGGLGLPGDVCPHCKFLYFLAGLTCPTGCLYLPALCRKESR